MAIQFVLADYSCFPAERSAPAFPASTPSTARPRSVYWKPVLAVGAIAWILVAGVVVEICARLRPPAPMRPRLVQVSVTARPAPATAPAAPVAQLAQAGVRKADMARVAEPPAPAADKGRPLATPRRPLAAPQVLPASERLLADDLPADFKNYGTQVAFVDSPAEAARLAVRERKLLFLVHLSGNLEDPKFT